MCTYLSIYTNTCETLERQTRTCPEPPEFENASIQSLRGDADKVPQLTGSP